MRGLRQENLKRPKRSPKHVFASEDLVGGVATSIASDDNRAVRKAVRQRLLGRQAKNR